MRSNAKYTLKHGMAVWNETAAPETVTIRCPMCGYYGEQGVFQSTVNGNPTKFIRCPSCHGKHHAEQTYKKRYDLKGRLVGQISAAVWAFMNEHIGEIMKIDPAPHLHIATGVIGNAVRNKDKPVFDGSYHPGFLALLDAEAALVKLAEAMAGLYETDKTLYAYIYLRSLGIPQRDMDALGVFRSKLYKDEYKHTEFGKAMASKSLLYIVSNLPDSTVQQWGGKDAILAMVDRPDNDRGSLVACPRCAGSDDQCPVCTGHPSPRGQVPKRIADKYLEKIANGEEWS